MSDRIKALISEIGEKVSRINGMLSTERLNNEKLQNEVSALQEQLISEKNVVSELQTEIAAMRQDINAKSEHVVEDSKGKYISEDEIDEMVKEIEYCIGQLKE